MATTTSPPAAKKTFSLLPTSTLGKKYLVAITGIGLSLFTFFHMAGNMQVFLGPAVLNHYAHFLKSNPEILWGGRIGLLVFFVAHLGMAINLRMSNQSARPVGYVYQQKTINSTMASRTMIITGLAILLFLLYHLAHFTLGWTNPNDFNLKVSATKALDKPNEYYHLDIPDSAKGTERDEMILHKLEEKWGPVGSQDVYSMVVHGFRQPLITLCYVLAMVFLGLHMSHGVASSFQTLGANRPRWHTCIKQFGLGFTVVVIGGNILIAVLTLVRLSPVPPQPM